MPTSHTVFESDWLDLELDERFDKENLETIEDQRFDLTLGSCWKEGGAERSSVNVELNKLTKEQVLAIAARLVEIVGG